ncbi:hypothetical protein K435DRAFT_808853 [Dendrothele bispora CBS 962.96]|uniref:BTB domain-containing protein n=1 Tax=Dendrothele bispora (strain CBS 962.96) TaxID=1314807 RepID=A0A4S8L0A8_DENBC|nr:hypothetical protein K435DRAFT_808853 [Dendrothele bispora CBS 962.96]
MDVPEHSQPNPAPAEAHTDTSQITPHPRFFYSDGSIFLPYIEPLRLVWDSLPPPEDGAEGSINKPISMGHVDDQELEAYMELIYCPNMLLEKTPKPYMFYLHILRLSSMYEWPEARAYAIEQISSLPNQELEPYLKLLLGLRHRVEPWVLAAVNSLFFSGPTLSQPVHKQIYGMILDLESRASINWVLQEGSRLMEKTIHELITNQPGFFAGGDDGEWGLFQCDNHQACVKALNSRWHQISSTLVSQWNDSKDEAEWSLAFQMGNQMGDYIKCVKMNKIEYRKLSVEVEIRKLKQGSVGN